MPPVKIAVAGRDGHMGRTVISASTTESDLVVIGGFGRPDMQSSGLIDRSEAIATADVIIDFTTPAAATELAVHCAAEGGPALVIGATGFEPAETAGIVEAARRIPIVRSGNFSIGLNMLLGLVARTAQVLRPKLGTLKFWKHIIAARGMPHPGPR